MEFEHVMETGQEWIRAQEIWRDLERRIPRELLYHYHTEQKFKDETALELETQIKSWLRGMVQEVVREELKHVGMGLI